MSLETDTLSRYKGLSTYKGSSQIYVINIGWHTFYVDSHLDVMHVMLQSVWRRPMTSIVNFSFFLLCRFLWVRNCNSVPIGQLGNATAWQGLFIRANTIVSLLPTDCFSRLGFFANLFLKTPFARIHPLSRRTHKDSHRENVSLTLRRPTAQPSARAFGSVLGRFSPNDPSADNRHFSNCETCIFPAAVFQHLQDTQILGVWRAESFLSCGYLPVSISVFLVSIHLGLHRWSRQTSLKSLSSVSHASESPSAILLIRLHHASCHPSPSPSASSLFSFIEQHVRIIFWLLKVSSILILFCSFFARFPWPTYFRYV